MTQRFSLVGLIALVPINLGILSVGDEFFKLLKKIRASMMMSRKSFGPQVPACL